MDKVAVKFKGSEKVYIYNTKLDLILGATYYIVADGSTTYNNYVTVVAKDHGKNKLYCAAPYIRTITSAFLVNAPKKPTGNIKKIYINYSKKTTTVIWKDGTKTTVKCGDELFDFEKGIAMCFMKKAFDNRGCFNDVFNNADKWEMLKNGVTCYE